jgi:hypothetical protein
MKVLFSEFNKELLTFDNRMVFQTTAVYLAVVNYLSMD